MAAIKSKKMIQTLTSKFGFEEHKKDHRVYVLEMDGRKYVRTKVLRSKKKDIDDYLLRAMARQMAVKYLELLEMVSCAKGADWYCAKLRAMD
jgi:hypothetical protein